MSYSSTPQVAEQVMLRATTVRLDPESFSDVAAFSREFADSIARPILSRIELVEPTAIAAERDRDIEDGIDTMTSFIGQAALVFRAPASGPMARFQRAIEDHNTTATFNALTRHRAPEVHVLERAYGLRREFFKTATRSLTYNEYGNHGFFSFEPTEHEALTTPNRPTCPFDPFVSRCLPVISACMLRNGLLEIVNSKHNLTSTVQ